MYSNIGDAWAPTYDPSIIKNDNISSQIPQGTKIKNSVFENKDEIFNFKNPHNKFINTESSLGPYNLSELKLSLDNMSSTFPKEKKKSKVSFAGLTSDSDNIPSKCVNTVAHLETCKKCYDQLKNLMNSKISKKMDEIILDQKLKQLQMPNLNQSQTQLTSNNSLIQFNTKDILLIVMGIIIIILLVVLLFKIKN